MSTLFQRSFAAGEITPAVWGRVDMLKYQTGLRSLLNMVVRAEGGTKNRAGSQYCVTPKLTNRRCRLMPFVVDDQTELLLEVGHQYIRVLRDGQYVMVENVEIYGIAKDATGTVTTNRFHGLRTGDIITITGVVGMTQVNGGTFTITVTFPGEITLNVNTTGYTTYVSGGIVSLVTPRPVEVTTPWTEDQIKYLQQDQFNTTGATGTTFTHQSGLPKNLIRNQEDVWTFATPTFLPQISAPGSVTNSGAAGSTTQWRVTAVDRFTFEESLPSAITGSSATPSSGSPITVSWAAVSNALEYNIYRFTAGNWGFVGTSYATSFLDYGDRPDITGSYPEYILPFFDANPGSVGAMYPAVIGSFQQRRIYGNIGPIIPFNGSPILPSVMNGYNPMPDGIMASAIGSRDYFHIPRPLTDDAPFTFRLKGVQAHTIRHFLDIGALVIFTSKGAWVPQSEALTPTSVNPKRYSYYGCTKHMPPIVINGDALYIQETGQFPRSLIFEFQVDGYKSNNLGLFSAHLFKNKQLEEWTYQQAPDSLVWVVRDDGTLACLTYVPEQMLMGWSRHEFENGFVESVCSIKENGRDVLYLSIRRVIDGTTVRYIERLNDREYVNTEDGIFVDSSKTYDGTNYDPARTMTLSGGTTWDENETLTLTCSASFFAPGDVGKAVHIRGPIDESIPNHKGVLIRANITAYTSGTVVSVVVQKDVPVNMQGVAISNWGLAIKTLTGLDHLEGQDVSVLGDGFVVASVNNPAYDDLTVDGGEIELPMPYVKIHVGLPILAEMETLNIDTAQSETLIDKKKLITQISMWVERTRAIWAGSARPKDDETPITGLTQDLVEAKVRADEGYDDPVSELTGVIELGIQSQWNDNGRVILRQIDPVAAAISTISPTGYVPIGG